MSEALLVGVIVLQGMTMWQLNKLIGTLGRMLCQQAVVFGAASSALEEAQKAMQP